jgi:hypothetical protein
VAAAALLLAACGGDAAPPAPIAAADGGIHADRVIAYDPGTLAIAGDYADEFGPIQITPDQWFVDYGAFGTATYAILSWDNRAGFLVAQNGPDTFNPNLYSRFDWVLVQGTLYSCQQAYDAATAGDAEADEGADRADLEAGCGLPAYAFPWSNLGAPAWKYVVQPEAALGAPQGGAQVASLGYLPGVPDTAGGTLTLGFGASGTRRCIVDGEGDDLAVYENAFLTGDLDGDPFTSDPGTYNEVATVEVSADNLTWYAFPASIDPGNANLLDPARYNRPGSTFAGVTPTALGGDGFDLADLIARNGLPAAYRACYLRLTDGGTLHPDYGNTQSDLFQSGADPDAVRALHAVAAPGLVP